MRKTICFTLILLVYCSSCLAFERKAKLQFQPKTPVHLLSEAMLEVNQAMPSMSLSTKGSQSIQATLTLNTDQLDLPVTQPPFDLAFTLKALKISLKANNEELSFNSEDMESSLYLNQLAKLIGMPIEIRVGEGLKLEKGSEKLSQIVQELPVIQEAKPEVLLEELFRHLFALAGDELKEGKVIERQYNSLISSVPNKVVYTITNIDDYAVHAKIEGNLEKKSFSLEGKVQIDQNAEEPVVVTLGGTMDGTVKWNRDNAMLYEMNANYRYSAMFKLGGWEWMMDINVALHNQTKLK